MIGESGLILAMAIGVYSGQGTWYDSAAASHKYDIQMRVEQLPNGSFRQWFKHVFVEEGGSVIEQTLDWAPTGNGIFDVILVGTPIRGRGYCSGTACHYSLPVPNNFVEGTVLFSPSGVLEKTIGSAEKNSQGIYIWWEEQLHR